MNNPEKENLNRLFEAFLDAEAAKQAAQDIEQGDKLLNAYPAPQPSDGTILKVKDKVAAELKRRRREVIELGFLKALSVAAAIVTISIAAHKYFERGPIEQPKVTYASAIPDKIWEGSDITADDADFAVLSAEIETVKNTLAGVRLNDNYENSDDAVTDLEMELIEISGDIWKG